MIRFAAGTTLGLVITDENIKLLKEGRPLVVNIEEMMKGNPHAKASDPKPHFTTMIIHWSPTLQKAMKDLEPYLSSDTHILGKEN